MSTLKNIPAVPCAGQAGASLEIQFAYTTSSAGRGVLTLQQTCFRSAAYVTMNITEDAICFQGTYLQPSVRVTRTITTSP